MIEYIMEHIAYVTKQNPVDVRLANLNPQHDAIPSMVEDLKKNSEFENRRKEVEAFNQVNLEYLLIIFNTLNSNYKNYSLTVLHIIKTL